MSERAKRAKAASKFSLEGLAEARQGKSRLENLELEEEEDVFDVLDEDEYEKLVEKRRAGEDFVVDDDGLGYHDDGEEMLGVGEDAFDARKRLKEQARENDSKVAKKARRIAEASAAEKGSILKHLQTGLSNAPKPKPTDIAPQSLLDIDALLDTSSSKKAPTVGGRPVPTRLPPARANYNALARPIAGSGAILMPGEEPTSQYSESADYYDDSGAGGFEDAVGGEAMDTADTTTSSASTSAAIPEPQKISLNQTTKKLKASEPLNRSNTTNNANADSVLMFQPNFGEASSGTMTALSAIDATSGAGGAGSGDFAGGSKIDPSQWVVRSTTTNEAGASETEDYVNMYWLDASEANGKLYIIGKVPLIDPANPNAAPKFVSACVVVHGCERNLFVLPRAIPDEFNEDGTARRANLGHVHKEISKLMVPRITERIKAKPVKRKYAFEHGSVPREECQYLKVVYTAKSQALSPQQCQGGEHYERIFGSSSSPLELFILKRKLMGPCWIKIRRPKLTSDNISYCRIEFAVDDPKLISRIDRDAPPAPMLTSLCISMKTAVNPATHLHELIAISGLIHTRVDSDGDTEMNPKLMRRFTLVRPLGVSCGSSYPAQFPHDIQQEAKKGINGEPVETCFNERDMISRFFARMKREDPDLLASHNLLGFEFDVLLARALANKVGDWSILGRLRKNTPPKGINDKDVAAGRILCDTYKAAKEFLRETTYSLTHLAYSQLQFNRHEVDPIDVPKYFSSSADIIKLAIHTAIDSMLVQRLMLKLQVVPLTKQLTNLSGNLWSRTIKGARAERIEYLLLHEFHALKYVLPEKKAFDNNKKGANAGKNNASLEDDGEDVEAGGGGAGGRVGGTSRKRAKAAYAGGLVLEPKKGLYDTYILLLDFNSLYPSIIQEYNLCFTTIDWTKFMPDPNTGATAGGTGSSQAVVVKKEKAEGAADGDSDEDDDSDNEEGAGGAGGASSNKSLPPLPESSASNGILPRVIRTLVDRRKQVKVLLKKERDTAIRQQLDIRQKALKLTANSMYGCLGFSFSRFYARPIAALVTAMGREALQRTVDLATNQMHLDVIYGDTDSVMINTSITDLAKVKTIGNLVKSEVNKLYKSLELDLDGIFKSMLLLKKKKYAAVTINEQPDGTVTYENELKGLDLVRRDWCPLSKNAGKFVVEEILSGKPREDIVMSIHDYLSELARKVRANEVPIEEFIVTKGLNKNPKDYPDCKGQAHLQVALQMLKANKPVNIGDHIPYVICTQGPEGAHAAQRAYHPDDVARSNGEYTLDYEWYLTNQILPPISRLCEPIEGTSAAIMSERLGLDASKFHRSSHNEDGMDDGWGFTPKCQMDDSERFKDCIPLKCRCLSCNEESTFASILSITEGGSGLNCSKCHAMYFGRNNASDCYCYLSNRITLLVRDCVRRYYECWLVCDDHSCGRRTMQQSAKGFACTEDCHGRMIQEYDETALHTQLTYLESLFDVHRLQAKKNLTDNQLYQLLPRDHVQVLNLLRQHMANSVNGSAYNWIRPSLWTSLFGKLVTNTKAQ